MIFVSSLARLLRQLMSEKSRAVEFSEMMQQEHDKLLSEQQHFFASKQQNAEMITEMQNQLTQLQSEHLRLPVKFLSLPFFPFPC